MNGMDMGEMNKCGDRVIGFAHDKTTRHFRLLGAGGFIQVGVLIPHSPSGKFCRDLPSFISKRI